MKIIQTNNFKRTVKKLHANQKADLDSAISHLIEHPETGFTKAGNLAGLRVYKFKMNKMPVLLAYDWASTEDTLVLMAVGSHQNFYRGIGKLGRDLD